MSEPASFKDLIQRVRAGDDDAAAELVRSYEPMIRRVARLRLGDSRLRRMFDSVDVCQSVLASFFVRVALGQYDLERPDQLLKLLGQMAKHKVIDQARQQRALRRDVRREEHDSRAGEKAVSPTASPSAQIAGRELLEEVRRRLSPEERDLAELRAEGREWADIAAERGVSAEALRKRLGRGLDRVAQQLGLDEAGHG